MKYWRVSSYEAGETAADILLEDDEQLTPSPHVHMGASPMPRGRELAQDPMEAFRGLHTVRMDLDLEDGFSASLSLDDAGLGVLLETTQRAKDYRELERRSVPAVYNFGREQTWSGGSDW